MAGDPIDGLVKRFQRAKSRRDQWNSELADGFRFAGSSLDSGFQTGDGKPNSEGGNRTRERFDDTAAIASREAGDTLHSIIAPAQQRFIGLKLGAEAAREAKERGADAEAAEALADARDKFFDDINDSNFHHVARICFRGTLISTAALGFYEDPSPTRLRPSSPFLFEAIPLHEIYPEPAARPRRRSVWRRRMVPVDQILEIWPAATLTAHLKGKLDDDDGADVEVVEAALWDRAAGNYRYLVCDFAENSRGIMLEQRQATSPFILFGDALAPGELLHRGRVLDSLSDIRTANTTVELVLKNASIAVTGMWQADDDGVINPAMIKLRPGAIIPKAVGSEGLKPLEAPGRFDVAELILDRLRERIELAIKGRQARPADKSHIAATSAQIDLQEVNLERMPGLLSLWSELVVPLFERGNDIQSRRGKVSRVVDLGGEVKVDPISPLMLLQAAIEVERAIAALSPLIAVDPQGVRRVVDLDKFYAWALERGGFPVQFINDEAAVQEAGQRDAAAAEAATAAELAGKAAPAVAQLAKLAPAAGAAR